MSEKPKIEQSVETEVGRKGVKTDTKVEVEGAVLETNKGTAKVLADPNVSVGRTEGKQKEIALSVDAVQVNIKNVKIAVGPEVDIHPHPSVPKEPVDRNNTKGPEVQGSIKANVEIPLIKEKMSVSPQASVNSKGVEGSVVLKGTLPGQDTPKSPIESKGEPKSSPNNGEGNKNVPPIDYNHIKNPLTEQRDFVDRIIQKYTQEIEKPKLIPDLKPPTIGSSGSPSLRDVKLGGDLKLKDPFSTSQEKGTQPAKAGEKKDSSSMKVHEPQRASTGQGNSDDKKGAHDSQQDGTSNVHEPKKDYASQHKPDDKKGAHDSQQTGESHRKNQ